MKKFAFSFAALVAGIILAAVYFSPLVGLGDVTEYADNTPVGATDGLCYAKDALVRVDFAGGESELFEALDRISARPVRIAESGGALIVYAFSPRVAARAQKLADGTDVYNVMAAARDGSVSIGTPLLSGCY